MGSRTVLTPRGSITHQNIEALKTMVGECTNNNRSEVILDCKTISFMDSEVLQFILKMHEDLKRQGGLLKIINVSPICRDIFLVTRLNNVFHIYEDIHKAIRSG